MSYNQKHRYKEEEEEKKGYCHCWWIWNYTEYNIFIIFHIIYIFIMGTQQTIPPERTEFISFDAFNQR